MGPRKFLHHGLLKKAKSNKEIVAFLCNDFLLLTYPANKTVGPQFSFEKHFDVKLKLYKKPILLDQISVLEQGPDTKRKSISGSGEGWLVFSIFFREINFMALFFYKKHILIFFREIIR